MKTVKHLQCKKTFSNDDLFYELWRTYELKYDSCKLKADKIAGMMNILYVDKSFKRYFYVYFHIKGTYQFLLTPFNTPHSEEVDTDAVLVFERFPDNSAGATTLGGFTQQILNESQNGGDYVEAENVDIVMDEKTIVDEIIEKYVWQTQTYKNCSINDKMTKANVVVDVKEIVAIDVPDWLMLYNGISKDKEYAKKEFFVGLYYPNKVEHSVAIPSKLAKKQKKFDKIIGAAKEIFMSKIGTAEIRHHEIYTL